jgi:GT2 family glycosyltransferase
VNHTLTVLMATHDRAELLARALRHLDEARRPSGWEIEILVVANACTDGTHDYLAARASGNSDRGARLPLRWVVEAAPGKSRALNRAITLVDSEFIAFVDDDHRVDAGYLEGVCKAATTYPDVDILCGRILPDWDGTEPAWVHDEGRYRIYPLPVPRYDLGPTPLPSPQDRAIPGGGNLVLRTRLFERVGGFSTEYGPVGHNLAGAEDQEWVRRAIGQGARLQYVPDIVQYHYADPDRLKLGYLMRKSYERSASTVRLSPAMAERRGIPRYLIRKVVQYSFSVLASFGQNARRFHLVRLAAALGEIKGHLQARGDHLQRSADAAS